MKYMPTWLPLVIVATGRLFAQASERAPAVEPLRLEPGKTVGRELAEGQSHEYSFASEAGQYARIVVDQRSINIAVTVLTPDGKELFSGDSYAIGESESAEVITDLSGNFRLRITPSESHAPNGLYAITLKDLEPATERLRMRVAATQEFARGIAAYMRGTREGILKAIEDLDNALALSWSNSPHGCRCGPISGRAHSVKEPV